VFGSTRGPGELAAAEEVDVQVGDGFAAMGTVVDHDAVARGEFEIAGDLGGNEEEVTEEGLVLGQGFADAGDQLFGNDQHMHRGLGLHIVDRDAVLILVRDLGGDFSVDDFLEYRFHRI